MAGNQGSMWPTRGVLIARYTRGSIFEGPGVIIKRVGGRSSPMISFIITFLAAPQSARLRGQQARPLVSLNSRPGVNLQNGTKNCIGGQDQRAFCLHG